MSPFKVNFSDGGTPSALLDVIFDTLDITSEEIEIVLRSELEKYKDKTSRDIIAQAFWAKGDEDDPFGLPLPDNSRAITYSQKDRRAFTDHELSGKQNVIRETLSTHYRKSTVQTFDHRGVTEYIVLQVLFKWPEFLINNIYAGLFEAADEWLHLNQDIYLIGLRGDRNNPMSWRPIGGGPFHVQYDSKQRVFIHEGKVIRKLDDAKETPHERSRSVAPKTTKARKLPQTPKLLKPRINRKRRSE